MRILQYHSDFIEYIPIKKEIKDAEEAEKKTVKYEDIVVLQTAVEKGDNESVAKKAINEVKKSLEVIKCNKILIYPFVHISTNPSGPGTALKILKEMEAYAKEQGLEVYRAPFGWNKQFSMKIKGHPLAEQSKTITKDSLVKGKKKEPKSAEKKGKFHKFVLFDKDGKDFEVTKQNWKKCKLFENKDEVYNLLKIFVRNELEGNPEKCSPKHVEFMRKLELIDYCPESDIGNMKWYPNGVLMFDLMHDYALHKIAIPWGAFKMKNPMIYKKSIKEISQLMGEFHERDYKVLSDDEEFVLRFAADPGGFPFMQKVYFSYKQMPVKNYEEAICFRREQSGECVGLRRLRNFHMTDMHAFCMNEKQAKEQYEILSKKFQTLMNNVIAKDWVLGFEIVEEYYDKWKDWFSHIVKEMKVPAFFKIMKEMSHYYAFKNEYQAIGADGANVQISTVQWDVKDGERFNISYVGEDGQKHPCLILHASSFGSMERAMYAILEMAAKMEMKGKAPMIPMWLSPEQVRLIPVSSVKHLEKTQEISAKLEEADIRVGVDDRDMTVPKRVFDAKMKWIPRIIVIGDKEMESGKYPVVIREKSKIKEGHREDMKLEELINDVKEKTKGMPFRRMYLPREVSKRPIFV
jgi:threonyl-tRNA synthetase